jgi:hypothetical protein
MNHNDEYLEDLEPYFLSDLGFEQRRQHTADPARSVEWSIAVPSDDNETRHEVAVLYELFITDNPAASWTENLNWYFEGVYLNTISLEERKQYELFREQLDVYPEDTDTFLENGTILRTRLPIETKQELVEFVNKLKRNKK